MKYSLSWLSPLQLLVNLATFKLNQMKKILIIIQKEFLTRVRKKTFLLGTLLLPLLYFGLITGTQLIAEKSAENLTVGIYDESGLFTEAKINELNKPGDLSQLKYLGPKEIVDKAQLDSQKVDGYMVIPASFKWDKGPDSSKLTVKTEKSFGLFAMKPFENKINKMWQAIKHDSLNIDPEKESILSSSIRIDVKNEKDKKMNAGIAATVGYVCGFLMYLILLLYGSQVMMAVTEEKTSRIAEIIVSSVKPFQLMIGKIVGIILVALAQVGLWILCLVGIYYFSSSSGGNQVIGSGIAQQIQSVFDLGNLAITLCCFVFYLLGGLLFYSSLYAAIGSAINEDMKEAQSLSFPITMIIIFSIAIMAAAIANPTGSIATWASIIPFSSPIVMMVRVPFGVPGTVPYWQLALSMLLLIVSFIGSTWFAGKIFRTGILMYGKKPSWKEMIKWAFAK